MKFWTIPLTLAVLLAAVVPAAAAPAAELPAAPIALTSDEIAGLQFMVEEEKLARDVYLALGQTWNAAIFQSIAASEQSHMDALRALLTRYGISDPSAGLAAGQFVNPELQALYHSLVAQGGRSLADALKVGALIEEIDIRDLQARLAGTAAADIRLVYENLMAGSANHLRAFTTALQNQTGETYVPQALSTAEYQAVLDGTSGRAGIGASTDNGRSGGITSPAKSRGGLGGRR